MAKVDITGLLTGLAGTPDLEREGIKRASAVQGQGLGSNLARSLALQAPQREQMMRQGAGGLFGVDTRTAGQQVEEQLGQVDTSTPAGKKQAIKLIAQIDPVKAMELQNAFSQQEQELAAEADSGIGKINPQQYTPASVQQYNEKFRNTGIKDYNLLEEIDLAGKTFEIKTMENIVSTIGKRGEAFQSSMKRQADYTNIEKLLDAGLNTGALAGLTTGFKAIASDVLGVDIEGLGEIEALESISNKLALGIRNPASGMGLPGATSNRDLDFLLAAIPGLRKSEAGNRLMIKIAREEHKLAGDLRREQQRIIKENGGKPPLDLEDRLVQYFENYQIDPSLQQEKDAILNQSNKDSAEKKAKILADKLAAFKKGSKTPPTKARANNRPIGAR